MADEYQRDALGDKLKPGEAYMSSDLGLIPLTNDGMRFADAQGSDLAEMPRRGREGSP
jgi:hypothetical protein